MIWKEKSKKKSGNIQIHLRPYDKLKYEVPIDKIKINSGYALIDVEPFPRGRIMKICYNILEQLKIGIPETAVYRIYTEEKVKYIMNAVDEIDDVEELEKTFGVESIELFIVMLAMTLQAVPAMRQSKPWQNENKYDPTFMEDLKIKPQQKYPQYQKGQRPTVKFTKE